MKFHRNNLFDEGKVDKKTVNIFHRHSNRITFCLPTHYKTYCFAFQKRRFCTVKVAVLRCKTYAFATPNRNYHFSYELSLQNYSFNVGSATHCVPHIRAAFLQCQERTESHSYVLIRIV